MRFSAIKQSESSRKGCEISYYKLDQTEFELVFGDLAAWSYIIPTLYRGRLISYCTLPL